MTASRDLPTFFEKSLRADMLSHGYLLFGTAARGDEAFQGVYAFASSLESAPPHRVLLDTSVLSGREVGIDSVREAIHFLWERPLRSPRKTLIVRDADLLTLPAGQALLKVLEEPPSHAWIVLISKDVHGIMPPLASRLQKIYVSGSELSETRETALEIAKSLLDAKTAKERSEILKMLMEKEELIAAVVKELIALLRKDTAGNSGLLRALTRRWALMERFTTNRKLQLEAAFAEGLGH